ncbi:MAG: AmmeMemoRadiSam system radical SAM enzyme [Clostridia bacterium]|nr:AmmeMemoRadiSam system radical SAM enzyme [Clostridia bacterium]
MQEAAYYKQLADNRARCLLCPQFCQVEPDKSGFCRARINQAGRLYSHNYAQITSIALDPIEKKPLYHFHPGRKILSVGTWGCNLHCAFCQNWQISQLEAPAETVSPEELVEMAEVQREQAGNIGLAYTYSEPLIWFEYIWEASRLARAKGLKNVVVSNGLINPQPLNQLLPWIDAFDIDLKAFGDNFYQELCQGKLEPVKQTIQTIAEAGVPLEVTTLVIEGWNEQDIEALSEWLAGINPRIPLHLSRYFPNYYLGLPPTSEKLLVQLWEKARQKLKYVYLGNVESPGQDTFCPECGKALIKRRNYQIKANGLKENRCRHCKSPVDLILT